eukprot:Gb_29637 [translate_table: standard]
MAGNELSAQDIFELFLRERQASGDFISRTSDVLWKKEVLELDDNRSIEVKESLQQLQKMTEDESGRGFLKLNQTRKWVSGNGEAPVNNNVPTVERETDSENRRRISLLEYEALKRELLLITVGVAVACTGYCFLTFSPQVALSYAVGSVASCLYLQLLYRHTDNVSKEKLADVFIRKRAKKIGIRSDDLKDSFEKIVRGSALALSSPRLVIPAALFGFWTLSKHYFGDSFDFQLTPAVLGLFAYKAAALVQVYRDNEDLLIVLPQSEENSEI